MGRVSGAGPLDRRITIRRKSVTAGDFNSPVETWHDDPPVWAAKQDASAAEGYRAQEVGARITRRFTIRWSANASTITPEHRVLFEGIEHDIVAVRDVGRRRWREIDAVARAEAQA